MNELRHFGLIIMIVGSSLACESCNLIHKNDNNSKTDSVSAKEDSIDYNKIGEQLLQNEKFEGLAIGLSINKTIDLLGEPNERTELELWSADGEYHQTFSYNDKGIEIDIVGENNSTQKIGMITITKPCTIKSKGNIGIGSSTEDVKAVYNGSINPKFSDSNSIVVGSIYGGLIFVIENDNVAKIIVGKAAE